jgi:uncharacterized protein YjlB
LENQVFAVAISVPEDFADVLRGPDLRTRVLAGDGTFPNNEALPVLVYGQAVRRSVRSVAVTVDRVFGANDWTGAWRNGIFSYHHYHSTTHEMLGVTAGTATVQLGGPDGWTLDMEAGDVLVLPAGVAHKNLGSDPDFQVVGAYPDGQSWDLRWGEPGDRPEADRNIKQVPLPSRDPLYGADGPLLEHWADD